MDIIESISQNLQKGRADKVREFVEMAVQAGIKPRDILQNALLDPMTIVRDKFDRNEVYLPLVLVASSAMYAGIDVLKPYLCENTVGFKGRVCIGTVKGDLHDIGKNLVKTMMESRGLEVIDLGTDVAPEDYINAVIEHDCQLICCSALLTTTMGIMKEVVDAVESAGLREKVKIMVGGAPITKEYCEMIGADRYTENAVDAADAAVEFCK